MTGIALLPTFARLLGFRPAGAALAAGFTHHGRRFFVPVWLAPDDPEFPVAAKWAPLELLMPLIDWVEQTLAAIMFPDAEPAFQYAVGPAIGRRA